MVVENGVSLTKVLKKEEPDSFSNLKNNSSLNSFAAKLVYKNDGLNKSNTSFGEIPKESNVKLYESNSSSTPSKKDVSKDMYKAINTTKTIISITDNLAKFADQHETYAPILGTSDGALSASKAILDLKNVKESENTTKTIISSVSGVAGGVGTVLGAVNIPEAEFLHLTSKVLGLGVEQQNLTENIQKNDPRGIVGTSVGMVKGLWGTVLSGAKAAKVAANLGNKFGKVSVATVGKISDKATAISKFADKIAIPFAIAGTGLSLWDWRISEDKADEKATQLSRNETKIIKDNGFVKVLQKHQYSKKEQEIRLKESETLRTNANLKGISFGISAISTVALITSVAFPPAAAIAGPVAIGGNIAASVVNALSSEQTRETVKTTYKKVATKYTEFLDGLYDLPGKLLFSK